MMGKSLSSRSARPRSHARKVGYPRLTAIGAMLTAACGGATPGATQPVEAAPEQNQPATVATVPVAPSGEPMIIADEPATPVQDAVPLATSDMHFPVDDEPLENNSCRGRCPAPYTLGLNQKDRGQIEARIRYCANAAAKQGYPIAGSIAVTAHIEANGRASDVRIKPADEVAPPLVDCVRRLVASAPFSGEHGIQRETSYQTELDKL